jgi:hypothetical protein
MFSCHKHQKFFINGSKISFMIPQMFEIACCISLPLPVSLLISLPASLWLPIPALSSVTWNFYSAVWFLHLAELLSI